MSADSSEKGAELQGFIHAPWVLHKNGVATIDLSAKNKSDYSRLCAAAARAITPKFPISIEYHAHEDGLLCSPSVHDLLTQNRFRNVPLGKRFEPFEVSSTAMRRQLDEPLTHVTLVSVLNLTQGDPKIRSFAHNPLAPYKSMALIAGKAKYNVGELENELYHQFGIGGEDLPFFALARMIRNGERAPEDVVAQIERLLTTLPL